jgi:MFS family permease
VDILTDDGTDPTHTSEIPLKEELSIEASEDEQVLEEADPTYKDVFKNKHFMRLLTGQLFSNFGDAIFRISIQFFVYHLTGSATAMTLVLAAQTIPWIIIGPIAGVFADRVSRKAIMIGADIVRGLSILILPFLTYIAGSSGVIYGVVIIAFILGAASATFVAPRSAAIPEITGLRLYVKAISLSQLVFQTLAVLGPIFAAPIYVFLGEQTFWITSGCYFVSAIVIYFTLIPSANRDKSEKMGIKLVINDLKNGFSFLLKHPTVRVLIFLFTFIVIGTAFSGPLLLPYLFEIKHNAVAIQYFNVPSTVFLGADPTYLAVHYYGTSPAIFSNYEPSFLEVLRNLSDSQFGYLGASSALGSILGNLAFGRFEKIIGRPKAILMGSVAISGYYFVFFFKPGFIVLLFAGFTLGLFNGMFSLAINAAFAENVPNEIRGRAYSATNAYIQVLSVACLALSGLTADSIGIVITITGSGIFLLITTVIVTIWTKAYKFAAETPNPYLHLEN